MQQLKNTIPDIHLTNEQKRKIDSLPEYKREKYEANTFRIIRGKQAEAYDRMRLKSYGMWDDDAARRGKLTITRIEKSPIKAT